MNEMTICWGDDKVYEAYLTIKLYTSPLTADTRDVYVIVPMRAHPCMTTMVNEIQCKLMNELVELEGNYTISMETVRDMRNTIKDLLEGAEKIRTECEVCGGSLRKKFGNS